MNFFSFFYSNGIYGPDLFYHLCGYYNNELDMARNQMPKMWCAAFFSAALVFVIYYYILNHPRVNKLWHWLVALVIPIIGVFLFSRGVVMSDIAGSTMCPIDPDFSVSSINATMFGLYNGILSGIFYFLLSVAFRFGSKNCKNVPFKSLINKK